MELRLYAAMIRRWAWLLVTGIALGAMLGAASSILQTPVYQSSTRILVMRPPQEKANDYAYISDQQLVQTYIQLLTTQPVLQRAAEISGAPVNKNQVSVTQVGDTQTIQVTVEDRVPQRASDVANLLVQALIEQNEIIQAGRYASVEQSINAQIAQIESQINALGAEIENVSAETVVAQQRQVEAQINALQAEVAQLQNEVAALKSSASNPSLLAEKETRLNQTQSLLTLYQQTYADLVVLGKPVASDDKTTRLAQLQSALQLYQQIYTSLLSNLESIRLARLQNMPNVAQIEPAFPASRPVRPRPVANTALAGMAGLILAGGIAFLIEYLDDTIRSPEDIERILNAPVIGYIGGIETAPGETPDLHALYRPRSPVTEAFRSLRANLEFASVDRGLSKILVTSVGPGEGKTTVAVNLALILAQSGKRALLIDADMRRPRVHFIFNVSNNLGLSSLFRGNMSVAAAARPVEGANNVFIMTSGSPPPNPTELLASAKMEYILREAEKIADVVILDSPPSLVADYQVLAAKVDGVLLVVQPGQTQAEPARAMIEQLRRANAHLLGVVLNKVTHDSYGYSGYHSYYYEKENGYYSLPAEPVAMLPPEPVEPAALQPQPRPAAEAPEAWSTASFSQPIPAPLAAEPLEAWREPNFPQPAPRPAVIETPPPRPKSARRFNPNEAGSYIIQERQLIYWQSSAEEELT